MQPASPASPTCSEGSTIMDSDDVIALPITFVQAILQHDHIAPCLGHVLVAGFDDQHASVDVLMQHHPTEARYKLLGRKETDWLRFMQHGLSAVQHLHHHGFVHMNVTMDNFVAHAVSSSDISFELTGLECCVPEDCVSRPGGSRWHMAPEVLFSHQQHGIAHAQTSADVWSFGITLLELVCGDTRSNRSMPSIWGNIATLMNAHNSGDGFFECLQHRINLGKQVWDGEEGVWLYRIIAGCLAAEERFRPSVSELLEQVTERQLKVARQQELARQSELGGEEQLRDCLLYTSDAADE